MLKPDLNQEQGLRAGTTIDQVGKGGREDAIRSDSQTNLYPANLPTLRCQGWRLGLRGATGAKSNCSFLPVRVTRNFGQRRQEDASRTQHCRLCPVGQMEV